MSLDCSGHSSRKKRSIFCKLSAVYDGNSTVTLFTCANLNHLTLISQYRPALLGWPGWNKLHQSWILWIKFHGRHPLDQVLHIRIFGSRRDYGIQILQYRESFRLVLFPSRDLFSWKHKLEVKEVHLSEDIPRSTGLCTLSCSRERFSAETVKSIFDVHYYRFQAPWRCSTISYWFSCNTIHS